MSLEHVLLCCLSLDWWHVLLQFDCPCPGWVLSLMSMDWCCRQVYLSHMSAELIVRRTKTLVWCSAKYQLQCNLDPVVQFLLTNCSECQGGWGHSFSETLSSSDLHSVETVLSVDLLAQETHHESQLTTWFDCLWSLADFAVASELGSSVSTSFGWATQPCRRRAESRASLLSCTWLTWCKRSLSVFWTPPQTEAKSSNFLP